jgi:hypothetical protein
MFLVVAVLIMVVAKDLRYYLYNLQLLEYSSLEVFKNFCRQHQRNKQEWMQLLQAERSEIN